MPPEWGRRWWLAASGMPPFLRTLSTSLCDLHASGGVDESTAPTRSEPSSPPPLCSPTPAPPPRRHPPPPTSPMGNLDIWDVVVVKVLASSWGSALARVVMVFSDCCSIFSGDVAVG
ncbi:hypothetical protein BDA96_05G049400 [Sorghum bicolor]|uniref:Uncharacterized protein n=1 Tax=Sorghum bicolor TaxID=4558 RepID=A0A921UED7_SORBI|nr:hypothetical protein BDA96_05G049400 [Sorghum bicolor]